MYYKKIWEKGRERENANDGYSWSTYESIRDEQLDGSKKEGIGRSEGSEFRLTQQTMLCTNA